MQLLGVLIADVLIMDPHNAYLAISRFIRWRDVGRRPDGDPIADRCTRALLPALHPQHGR